MFLTEVFVFCFGPQLGCNIFFTGMFYSLIEQRLANLKSAALQMLSVKSSNWMIVHRRP